MNEDKLNFECKRCGEMVEKAATNKQDFKPQFCDKCLDYFFGNEPKTELGESKA